ncbi:hypothetical protein [Actinoplanes sp. URMC 104]|uniref:hypothetical protein n=1 Tax=Actinoplanes sp. URMC 104 TaxID=3423409 RepID=UPI003F1D0088
MGGRVLWIGGSPCSGKSTVAAAIAARWGASVYSCDDAFDRHVAQAGAAGPTLRRVAGMSAGDRLRRPIAVQVGDVFGLYREEFPLIEADLAGLPGPVVAEGAALLPELVAARGVPPERAVWLVPTERFQREHYARRRWAWSLLGEEQQPEVLFERWMCRDARFASVVAGQARERGYRVVVVDGSLGVGATIEAVAEVMAQPLTAPAERPAT